MTAHVATAVNALRAHLATNLQAELTTVETEDGLAAGALTLPVAFLGYEEPGDNRSPLVEVYETRFSAEDQRNGLWDVAINVDITCQFAVADMATAFATMRRYLTAVMRCVMRNPTLSGLVRECILTGGDRGTIGDKSAGRHAWRLAWIVAVHSTV